MKSYKLFDLETKQIFTSRDVFHENIFPFQNNDTLIDHDPFDHIVLPISMPDNEISTNTPASFLSHNQNATITNDCDHSS